jgi:hypothetical protein
VKFKIGANPEFAARVSQLVRNHHQDFDDKELKLLCAADRV